MLTRRIAISACALCLAVPAAASAQPAFDVPAAYGGPTEAAQPAHVGDTKNDLPSQHGALSENRSYADRVGSLSAEQLAAAYGTTKPVGTPISSGSTDDGTDGWRIAAISEAGVLGALALGATALVAVRTRPRRRALSA